jgi:hypothetical protein
VRAQGRALPLAGRVRPGPKGPGPEDLPSALVELGSPVLPAGTHVGGLGAGAGAGSKRPETRHEAGGWEACRPATGHTATGADETLSGDAWGACRKPGRRSERQAGARPREA